MQAFEIYTTDPSASSRGPAVKDSDPYVPLDYELLVRGEAEESPRVVYDTYSFGMTVPQYNLELFQSGEVHTVRFDFWVDFLLRSFDTDSCCGSCFCRCFLFCKWGGDVLISPGRMGFVEELSSHLNSALSLPLYIFLLSFLPLQSMRLIVSSRVHRFFLPDSVVYFFFLFHLRFVCEHRFMLARRQPYGLAHHNG